MVDSRVEAGKAQNKPGMSFCAKKSKRGLVKWQVCQKDSWLLYLCSCIQIWGIRQIGNNLSIKLINERNIVLWIKQEFMKPYLLNKEGSREKLPVVVERQQWTRRDGGACVTVTMIQLWSSGMLKLLAEIWWGHIREGKQGASGERKMKQMPKNVKNWAMWVKGL